MSQETRTRVVCAGCNARISALHAGHVAVIEHDELANWWYFCDRQCRQRAEAAGIRLDAMLPPAREIEVVQRSPIDLPASLARTPSPAQTPSLPPVEESTPSPGGYPTAPDATSTAPGLVTPWSGTSLSMETSATAGPSGSGALTGVVTRLTPSGVSPTGNSPTGSTPASSRANLDVNDDDAPTDLDALLLAIAGASGALTVALGLLGASPTVTGARVIVSAVGVLALGSRVVASHRDPSDAHPIALLAAPVVASGTAIAARISGDARASEAASLAGVLVMVAAILLSLRRRVVSNLEAERRWIAEALALPARRVGGADARLVAAHELRPGEEIQISAGEIVPADMVVLRGRALCFPWLGRTSTAARGEGDLVVAGARVIEGSLVGLTNWTGFDRAWARLILDPSRRIDVHGTLSKLGRGVAELGSLAAAGVAGLALFASNAPTFELVLTATAAHAALASTAVTAAAAVHALRGVLAAARRGIAFRSPKAWDDAGRVAVAVFSSRGTLLLGEPDVVEVEPTGKASVDQVLGWVAGVGVGQSHPVAGASLRAARRRAVSPDAVRSVHLVAGLGVSAVTSTGEPLLVGSRALMLQERVSIALAEPRVAELEALGRNVQLVAVGGKLVGLVALQDGLRPGARPAVQHLLDVEVEPVLLSGDARETCEAIARALDIDHVRPEVLPNERAEEVRSISQGGARVAALGRPDLDSAVLGAADVAVALGAAGSSPGDWAVSLASDDVRDAALAIALAHRTRTEARTAFLLAVGPGIFAAIAVTFRVLPPIFSPLVALVGGLVTMLHARSTAAAWGERSTPWDLPSPSR